MEKQNELRKWIIYMYTFPNGKRYIGKTCTSLSIRQNSKDWRGYAECPAVFNAINKYGIKNIEESVIFEDYIKDDYAGRLEAICIALFKTNCNRYRNPEYGYNLTDGGDGVMGPKPNYRGKNHHSSKAVYCIELDCNFDNARIAEKETGISYGSISNCCCKKTKSTLGGTTGRERLHWLFSDQVSNEAIYEVLHTYRFENNFRKIYCIELDQCFVSITSAHEAGFGTVGNIAQCCSGKTAYTLKDGKMLHWLYAEDVTDNNIQQKLQLVGKTSPRQVYCTELDQTFVSVIQAQRETGITDVSYALKSKFNTAGVHPITGEKLHWIFVNNNTK